MSDTTVDRMRRQSVISRYAVLDALGLPRFCDRSGKGKVVFPSREVAEAARDELAAIDPTGDRFIYLCHGKGKGHFHFTSRVYADRSATVPAERVSIGDVVHVPGGVDTKHPPRHRFRVTGVGPTRLAGVLLDGDGRPRTSSRGKPRLCTLALTLLPHCTVHRPGDWPDTTGE